MAPVTTFNFRCERDNTAFTAELDDSVELYRPCPKCGTLCNRIVGTFTMPLSMGVDPDFPTAWDRWARAHKHQTKIAERLKRDHGDTR